MCGFVAVLTPDSTLSKDIVIDMRDRMFHRGPDGGGLWVDRNEGGAIALGHRRLSIVDLSEAASQPMFSNDQQHIIVFNGEIYNFVELKHELESKGHRFKTTSDTEVLMVAYRQWGVDCLSRLNGMFAFALWDKEKQHLFVARDRFGEKPVYIARIPGGGIAIASEAKALFAHPDIQATPNTDMMGQFIGGYAPNGLEACFFQGITRLPGAHGMLFNLKGEQIKQWRYWTPDYTRPRKIKNYDDVSAEFLDLFTTAIKMRLRTDVRVGACLSGGLDSSSIVGILSRLEKNGSALFSHTYSARFDDDPTMSEGHYIDMMLDHTGLSSQSVRPDPIEMIGESDRLHWHQEQPFSTPSMYLEWCVTRKARDTGTIVMLDGQGADELLAGYHYSFKDYQYDQLMRGRWVDLYSNTTKFNHRIQEESGKYVDAQRRIDVRSIHSFNEFPKMIFDAASVYAYRGVKHARNKLPGLPNPAAINMFRYGMARGLLYDSMTSNLHSADSNGMAHSIETRFPFLDYNLVDWIISLPNQALIHDGWTKYILRRAMNSILPKPIQWRVDKVGFAAPQDVWLRDKITDWAKDRLFDGPVTGCDFYDRRTIESLWSAHQSGQQDNSGILWRYISLNEWLTLFQKDSWKEGLYDAPLAARQAGATQ